MSKTNSLRKIIQSNINPILPCFYRIADKDRNYAYAVYSFENIDLRDVSRDDLILVIDLWDRGKDASRLEEFADQLEELFNAANMPGEEVLPTFYKMGRKPIEDEDKTLIRLQLKFQIQNYDIGG